MARADAINAALRQQWLATALRGLRPLAPVTTSIGNTARIKLDPVGLMFAIIIRCTFYVDIVGAIATPANAAPYSAVSRIRLTDTNAVDRIVITGEHAYALQALYERTAGLGQAGLTYSYPSIPTAIGNNQLVDVSFRIPVAGDFNFDLRGAMYMPAETQAYLFVDLIPNLLVANDDTALYKQNSGTVTINNSTAPPTVEVWQEFLDAPLQPPPLDLAIIHYIKGVQRITSGLGANTEQLIDYPTARTVKGFMFSQYVNGLQAVGNLGQLRNIVRANYDRYRITGVQQFIQQRRLLAGNDLQPGIWFLEHAPEVASTFAREYQAGITPAISGASQSLTFTFDTFGSQ